MSAELLALVLLLAITAYVLLVWWTQRRLRALGIAEGTIASADDSLVRAPTLRSERLGLVGRCDHLLRVRDTYVPVEQKPSARRFQWSHILPVGDLAPGGPDPRRSDFRTWRRSRHLSSRPSRRSAPAPSGTSSRGWCAR